MVCGGTVGTTNVGSRAPACPPFIVALRERGPTAIHGRRPRSGRGSDRFPDLEITFLTQLSKLVPAHEQEKDNRYYPVQQSKENAMTTDRCKVIPQCHPRRDVPQPGVAENRIGCGEESLGSLYFGKGRRGGRPQHFLRYSLVAEMKTTDGMVKSGNTELQMDHEPWLTHWPP
jgi:hypothetical protein